MDAQRIAIERYAIEQGAPLAETFVETESGKLNDRPQLNAALAQCRRTKAVLLIAKLDRLARNVAFVSALMETGVEFVAVDAPYANRLMLHVLSAVAEWEREQISERTKAALAAAKLRGVVLGKHGAVLGAQRRAQADTLARSLRPHICQAAAAGCITLRDFVEYLSAKNIPTPGGGRWHPNTVRRLLARLTDATGV